MSLYIGNDKGVLRIGSERCSRYRGRSGCVRAADPHCGWHDARETCVRAASQLYDPDFVQDTRQCPEENAPGESLAIKTTGYFAVSVVGGSAAA